MSEFTKIVSANWRDGRQSQNRWLVRDMYKSPEMAEATPAIYATGVLFCPSSEFEKGFGCSVVAFCVTATTEIPEGVMERAIQIHFDGKGSFFASDGLVLACDELILQPDGNMFAVLPTVGAGAEKEHQLAEV